MVNPPQVDPRRRRAVVAVSVALLGGAAFAWWAGTRHAPVPEGKDGRPPEGAAATEVRPATPAGPLTGRVLDAGGTPLPHAVVRAAPSADPLTTTPRTVDVGNDGAYTFTDLTVGAWDVTASLEGYASSTEPVEMTASNREVVFRLAKAAVLTGTLRAPEGSKLERGTVSIVGSGIWPARTVAANADGSFVFPDVPEGIYALRGDAEGLVSAPREGLLLEAGQRATADLMLEPAFELRGIVEDMDGKPVPNATVWVRQGSISMAAHGDERGGWSLAVAGLAKGTYRATASASHHVTVSAAGARVPGESLRLALPATATLRGTVRGPSGDTAPNTAVEVVGTDGAGLPVHLTAPPAEPEEEDSSASPLVPAGHLGVTLGGVPPISAAGAPGTARGGNAGFRTDAHGEFEITDVPPGSFRVLALADGYAPSSSASFAVESGDVLEAIDIRLDRGGELEVQVRSGRGTSVPNAQVTVLAAGDPMARVALTDAQGAARFPGILGTADVAVEAPGAAPVRQSAEVASGARATLVVDLAMGAAHVTGRTLDDRGVPIGRVHISIRGRQGAERTTVSDASGDFRIEGLEEGPYTLTATHERHARTTLRVSGETDALEVRLTSGTAVVGRVLDDWRGTPIRSAEVVMKGPAGRMRAVADRAGTFRIDRVAAGETSIAVSAKGYAMRTEARTITANPYGDTVDLGDFSLEPGATLVGVVLDALGRPVSGATVRVATASAIPAVRSGRDGAFRIEGLPAGLHEVHASDPNAGEATDGPYRVGVGDVFEAVRIHLPGRSTP